MSPAARVTVIVLSFNGVATTLACLESLLQHGDPSFSILVVDNASTDGSPATIRARHPGIALIELAENRGWAGGNNAGIRRALDDGAELVCLLNNDTIVSSGTIGRLAETASRFGRCLLHPAIDFADPAEGVQLDPSLAGPNAAMRALPQDRSVFELDHAYGACLMIPAGVVRSVGYFDERFFLQLEETDFWLRARRSGVRSLCDTQARIIHAESRSFGGTVTPMKTYYIVRNTLLLTEKHFRAPADVLRSLRSIYWMAAKLAQRSGATGSAASVIRWSLTGDPYGRAARAGVRDYLLRRFGRISAAGLRAIRAQPLSA